MLCHTILLPLIIFTNVVITIIHEIVKTVCNWVSTVIRTVKEIVEKICSWLPWPLDKICNLVTKTIEIFETIWNWVCNTFIEKVFEVLIYIMQLFIFIARVICIIITIIISFPFFILCLVGLRLPSHIRVSIKVLTNRAGASAVTPAAIQASMDTMRTIYDQCSITVEFDGVERIVAPDLLVTPDDWSGFLAPWHAKYSQLAFGCCNQITVFFIDDISGSSNGLTYWGDNWCRVDAGANTDPTIMAHEVGHMCSLWHDDDNKNLMFSASGPPTNPRNILSGNQCCWMQASPFITGGSQRSISVG
jgi:hypothetical protein